MLCQEAAQTFDQWKKDIREKVTGLSRLIIVQRQGEKRKGKRERVKGNNKQNGNRKGPSNIIVLFYLSYQVSLTIQNIILETYTTMINTLIQTDTCYVHCTYYRHSVFVGDVRSERFFVFFFKINFIEFDFLGTYIRNKRKNPPS